MQAQLSTSAAAKQQTSARRGLWIFMLMLLALRVTPAFAQGSEVERRIHALSAIDQQFMASQRAEIERLANRLGRSLTGDPTRDIDTLQQLLDRNIVDTGNSLTLQAMGIVFGDLLGDALSMDWVVYRDRAGRSRALRYRDTDTFVFPVTMISRRVEAGSPRPIQDIFNVTVDETQARLPGARWRS